MELETEQTHCWMLPHSFRLHYYLLAVHRYIQAYPLPETVSEKLLFLVRLRNLERRSIKLRWDGSSNAAIMLISVTGSLWLRACRMRCFIDITVSRQILEGCYTISALNSKTRFIVGYLEPLSTSVAVLKIFKNSTRFTIFFHSSPLHILSRHRSTSCWLINRLSIMDNKQFHLVGQSFFNVVIYGCRAGVAATSTEETWL